MRIVVPKCLSLSLGGYRYLILPPYYRDFITIVGCSYRQIPAYLVYRYHLPLPISSLLGVDARKHSWLTPCGTFEPRLRWEMERKREKKSHASSRGPSPARKRGRHTGSIYNLVTGIWEMDCSVYHLLTEAASTQPKTYTRYLVHGTTVPGIGVCVLHIKLNFPLIYINHIVCAAVTKVQDSDTHCKYSKVIWPCNANRDGARRQNILKASTPDYLLGDKKTGKRTRTKRKQKVEKKTG